MPYQRLARRLADDPAPAVTTLPDGSIDRYCRLSTGALDPVNRRTTFAREAGADGRKGFDLEPRFVEPGGQAVNAAQQAHALGARAACYGHLDDPEPGRDVFADLPFETVSMGRAAKVNVLDFVDSDLLLVEASPDLTGWSLADLREAAPLSTVFGVDAVVCANWVSTPGMAEAFHELGAAALGRVPFVFDPGDVLGATSTTTRNSGRPSARWATAWTPCSRSTQPNSARSRRRCRPRPPRRSTTRTASSPSARRSTPRRS
ncbi:hypothetical protein SY89_01207 [Halolamina pelagica]|uniref:Carbohydrate kinase PfkB domain-containing protein n=1 Tax=Halolamina pelagica TaxID=699431 RepID=A0A0P7I199_9EURY|nr:hypothetical protein SY89_01207 [Halolamina pelagica]